MPGSDASQLDAAAVRRLVEEVLRRIHAGTSPGAEPVRPAAAADGASVILSDAVIALAHVERLPAGTRRIVVASRAVVTPSARDRAREAGIAIARAESPGAAAPAAGRPFVIGQADCGSAAGRAAAIARMVPHAERLPATGLADVVAALATHASRDAARAVLLSSRPAAAVVLANRAPSLRAVTARDASTLAAAAAECAANLIVIDPAAFVGGVERACVEFAGRPEAAAPPELARAPAACGCQTHSH